MYILKSPAKPIKDLINNCNTQVFSKKITFGLQTLKILFLKKMEIQLEAFFKKSKYSFSNPSVCFFDSIPHYFPYNTWTYYKTRANISSIWNTGIYEVFEYICYYDISLFHYLVFEIALGCHSSDITNCSCYNTVLLFPSQSLSTFSCNRDSVIVFNSVSSWSPNWISYTNCN